MSSATRTEDSRDSCSDIIYSNHGPWWTHDEHAGQVPKCPSTTPFFCCPSSVAVAAVLHVHLIVTGGCATNKGGQRQGVGPKSEGLKCGGTAGLCATLTSIGENMK